MPSDGIRLSNLSNLSLYHAYHPACAPVLLLCHIITKINHLMSGHAWRDMEVKVLYRVQDCNWTALCWNMQKHFKYVVCKTLVTDIHTYAIFWANALSSLISMKGIAGNLAFQCKINLQNWIISKSAHWLYPYSKAHCQNWNVKVKI